MSARFRYMAPDGREVVVPTKADLLAEFTAGRLTGDTLLYDAKGGGWAPARSHSVLLALETPSASFTLAAADPLPPEDLLASVLRDRDEAHESTPALEGLTRLEGELSGATGPRFGAPDRGEADPLPYAAPRTTRSPSSEGRTRASKSFVVLGWIAASLAGLAVPAALAVLLADLGPLTASPPAAPPSGGSSRELSAIEVQAMEAMVWDLQSLRRSHRVERLPSVWLEGIYLAEASRFPDVRDYWTRYRGYVEQVQGTEARLFRANLVRLLLDEGATDATVAVHLGRALPAFEADRPRRDVVYSSMLDVAEAAVELHDVLVANESSIAFAPAFTSWSREPITEAVTEDPSLQREIDVLLDRIFGGIEAAGGDRVGPRELLPLALQRVLVPPPASPTDHGSR